MLSVIPWDVYREWQAYAALEPFDEERGDLRAASIVQVLANVNRDRKKSREPFTLDDVRLRFEGTAPHMKRQKSQDELQDVCKQWAAIYGAQA